MNKVERLEFNIKKATTMFPTLKVSYGSYSANITINDNEVFGAESDNILTLTTIFLIGLMTGHLITNEE